MNHPKSCPTINSKNSKSTKKKKARKADKKVKQKRSNLKHKNCLNRKQIILMKKMIIHRNWMALNTPWLKACYQMAFQSAMNLTSIKIWTFNLASRKRKKNRRRKFREKIRAKTLLSSSINGLRAKIPWKKIKIHSPGWLITRKRKVSIPNIVKNNEQWWTNNPKPIL